jgi:hypothetical protein
MKKLLIIFFLSIIFCDANAQVKELKNDDVPDFDIQLWRSSFIPGSSESYILRHRDGQWMAISSFSRLKDSVDTNSFLTAAYIELKLNDVFSLPDQSRLKLNGGIIDDGTDYLLTYKTADKTGQYAYSNPEMYLEHNKEIKELRFFCNILNVFQRLFPYPKQLRKPLR